MRVHDIPTPALLIEAGALQHNLDEMAAARPGGALRPHVKAHKCTALAARQAAAGHASFTCATPREMVGMAAAGLGDDLLLANEVLDPTRLAAMAAVQDTARVTVAVDSDATVEAAAAAGIREVLIDVKVGLPRCGCDPADAGRLADLARAKGLEVRGVMGYEGHLMVVEDRAQRSAAARGVRRRPAAGPRPRRRRRRVGRRHRHLRPPHPRHRGAGRVLRPDGHRLRQAGPALPPGPQRAGDGRLGLAQVGRVRRRASRASAWTTATRPSRAPRCGSAPTSTSPSTRAASGPFRPGDRVRLLPAHVDPTMAMHEQAYLVDGDDVLDVWPIDLRGW